MVPHFDHAHSTGTSLSRRHWIVYAIAATDATCDTSGPYENALTYPEIADVLAAIKTAPKRVEYPEPPVRLGRPARPTVRRDVAMRMRWTSQRR